MMTIDTLYGTITELAVRIGDRKAVESDIETLAFAVNQMARDLSRASDVHPGCWRGIVLLCRF
ncbi:hypothetical protein MUO14_11435 [Halobacillus shinanisalinarum]|uniref:HAMP domain-containing protein n=1 Tax=Halobacillus shinanisalinarum TaxID=2932258 RepID=A0ABY4H590_9BACI|nr:hypothetical protein [Halobacillus shinanisalinarum]UOQ95476.1 hypothetical protein MUO14_11435 [Halobacillus shinanisalinarum]